MISVIIPFYNSSSTLRRCINSVINQSYNDYDILLIDDGSTDDSRAICQEYALKNRNIRIHINPTNIGLYSTRVKSITLATGDYITFVDSDDYIDRDALLQLHNAVVAHGVDIVQMRHRKYFTKINLPIPSSQYSCYKDKIIFAPLLQQQYIQSFLGVEKIVPVFLWGKLFSTKLLKSITFPDLGNPVGDDQMTNLFIFHNAKSFISINYVGYNYCWGGMSNIPKIGDTHKYDHLLSTISAIAISLGYTQYLHSLKDQNERFFRYYIRHCITTFKLPKNEIIAIIMQRTKDEAEAIKLYSDEKKNTLKYFYKNIIRNLVS